MKKRLLIVCVSVLLLAGFAQAAMDDVIVWDGIRTTAQMADTLQNGYSSTTGMRLWWDFNDAGQLGKDVVNSYDGTVYGNAASLATDTPSASYAAGGRAASGFTTTDSMIVANPAWGPFGAYYYDRTYDMSVRNPGLDDSVFFSITSTEAGAADADVKRMWVNADGSITIGDRGYYTGFQILTSSPLTWDANAWYQINVVFDYTGADLHDIRVYRGKEGESQVDLLLDYESSSHGNPHYLAVGGHTQGWYSGYSNSVSKPGFLGEDTYVPEPATLAFLLLGGLPMLRRRFKKA